MERPLKFNLPKPNTYERLFIEELGSENQGSVPTIQNTGDFCRSDNLISVKEIEKKASFQLDESSKKKRNSSFFKKTSIVTDLSGDKESLVSNPICKK